MAKNLRNKKYYRIQENTNSITVKTNRIWRKGDLVEKIWVNLKNFEKLGKAERKSQKNLQN